MELYQKQSCHREQGTEKELMNAARRQREPVICQDENQVLFSCIYSDAMEAFLLIGLPPL